MAGGSTPYQKVKYNGRQVDVLPKMQMQWQMGGHHTRKVNAMVIRQRCTKKAKAKAGRPMSYQENKCNGWCSDTVQKK